MGPPVAVIKESPQFDVADTDVPLTVAQTGPPIIVEENNISVLLQAIVIWDETEHAGFRISPVVHVVSGTSLFILYLHRTD